MWLQRHFDADLQAHKVAMSYFCYFEAMHRYSPLDQIWLSIRHLEVYDSRTPVFFPCHEAQLAEDGRQGSKMYTLRIYLGILECRSRVRMSHQACKEFHGLA